MIQGEGHMEKIKKIWVMVFFSFSSLSFSAVAELTLESLRVPKDAGIKQRTVRGGRGPASFTSPDSNASSSTSTSLSSLGLPSAPPDISQLEYRSPAARNVETFMTVTCTDDTGRMYYGPHEARYEDCMDGPGYNQNTSIFHHKGQKHIHMGIIFR